jgi:hypothetical protein
MATEGWLTAVAGGRDTHLRICLAERPIAAALLTLNALRLLWVLPRVAFVGGRRTIPPELTREPVCEWVAVSRGGRRLGATIVVRANLRTVSGRA